MHVQKGEGKASEKRHGEDIEEVGQFLKFLAYCTSYFRYFSVRHKNNKQLVFSLKSSILSNIRIHLSTEI